MSDLSTNTILSMYVEEAPKPLFLSSMFKSPPGNYHNTEKVEIDIDRDNEEIAQAVPDISAGYRENEFSKYVNKSFTPPIFKEAGTVHAGDAFKRMEGRSPFEDPKFVADAMFKAFRIFTKLDAKVRRAIEQMAAQVMTTGQLTLKDPQNANIYTLNFGPKGAHLVTTTAWAADGTTGDPIGDVSSLATVLRRDGKQVPDRLIFGNGAGAWQRMLVNTNVKNYLTKLGYGLGGIGIGQFRQAPTTPGTESATYQGTIVINSYQYEIWTYDGFYKDPISGTLTPYIADNKVIVASSKGRLDLSFGAIPRILPPDPRVAGFLPERLSNSGTGLDMFVNMFPSADGEHIKVGCGCRPLTIPTAIDTFGCLTVF